MIFQLIVVVSVWLGSAPGREKIVEQKIDVGQAFIDFQTL
jgi:hypothetical protein